MSKYLPQKQKAHDGVSASPFKAVVQPAEAKAAKAPKPKSAHMHLMKRVKDHVARSNYLVSKREAEQTTAQPQLVRGKAKESAAFRSGGFLEVGGRFLEKAPGNNVASARVVLIQEGLGNLKDGYYYTKDALKQAVDQHVFEGKKMYADHPSKMEEQILPERSTRDIVGHYEDVAYEELEDGTGMLTANLLLMRGDPYQWVHSLVERAVDYSKKYANKQFIGLSINASGEAEPMDPADFLAQVEIPDSAKKKVEDAVSEGLNEIKVVRAIQDAVSVDLVTEAGAKGKILELLEAEKMAKQVTEAEKKEAEAKAKEAEEKAAKEAADKAQDGDDGEGDGEDEHDDEDADKALIMQMLKKQGLVGDDASDEECNEAMEMGGHYMKAAKAQGHEGEAAATHAAAAMKMAADVHAAMNAKKDDADADDGEEKPAAKEAHKEAKAMIELKAEVARLRESVRKTDLEKHLDKTLKATGLPVRVTNLIRESLVSAKSEKEIDKGVKTFVEAYKMDREEGFVVASEKTLRESNTKAASSLDDCVEEI